MNASNRTLGRVLLVVVGLMLLALGLGTIALLTVPDAESVWRSVVPDILAPFGSDADRGASTTVWSVALAVAVVVGVLAVVVIASRGGGRVGIVVEDDGSADGVAGVVTIESAAVQHALSSAIGAMPQVGSLAVDVYRVKRSRAIRIRVRPKRGVAPREIVGRVEEVVADLDALLGMRLPVLLQISRGGAGSAKVDRVH